MRPTYDVLMLVMNGIESDSRVLRTARTVADCGLSVLVVGLGSHRSDAEPSVRRLSLPGIEACLMPTIPNAGPEMTDEGEKRRRLFRHYEREVLGLVRQMRPRVIHTHDMATIATGHRLKAYFGDLGHPVMWLHDLHEWVSGLTTLPEFLRELCAEDERRSIKTADLLTTVSPAIAARITAEHGLPDRPTVLLNAPPTADFDPAYDPSLRTVLGLGEDTPLAVYCGQVKEARGVIDLVAALALLPELHVALVTNNRGPYVDSLSRRAADDGTAARLHFVPYVDQRMVSSFIRSASVGVHTLTRYGNGDVALPNKLFEYIHAFIPVVVSDCRAMAEFVREHDVGRSYRAGDPASLARSLRAVLSDVGRLRTSVAAVRDSVSWEHQEVHLRALYARMLGVGGIALAPPLSWPAMEDGKEPADGALKVLQGVAGSANQPWVLARALRRLGHHAHNVAITPPRLGFGASLVTPMNRMSSAAQFDLVRALADEFGVFHFHARSFFFVSRTFQFPTLIDLLLLRLLGKVIVFHFRGSEVRLASEFAARSPYHYVTNDPYGFWTTHPEDKQRQMIGFISAVADEVAVTDPELQEYVPGSVVIPRAIDLEEWRPTTATNEPHRPLVVHAPTRPEIKGTPHLRDAVDRLRAEGLDFEFIEVSKMRHEDARRLYERADVIVDQLLIGWYGVLAVEGMALGKAVISYVRPDLVHHLGDPMPLAVADPTTVENVLRRLLLEPDERRGLGSAARRYVEQVHDANRIAAGLEERYRALQQRQPGRSLDGAAIASFLRMQADFSHDESRGLLHAARGVRAIEERLAVAMSAINDVSQRIRERGDEADAASRSSHAIDSLTSARARLSSLDGELGALLGITDRHASVVEPTEQASSSPAVGEPDRNRAPAGRPWQHSGVSDAIAHDRWGVGQSVAEATEGRAGTWEEVGRAMGGTPVLALDVLDRLWASRSDPDAQAAMVAVAIGTARTMAVVEDALVAAPRAEGSVAPAVNPSVQVRLARHQFNMRREIGPEAELIARRLLRAVFLRRPGDDDAGPIPSLQPADGREELRPLCSFFINSATVSRTLDAGSSELYHAALARFAQRLHLWEVPAFRTTRTTLRATLPIRFELMPERGRHDRRTASVEVRGRGTRIEVESVPDDSAGGAKYISALLHAPIEERIDVDLVLASGVAAAVRVMLPELRHDPTSTTPRIDSWQLVAELALTTEGVTHRLTLPRDLLSRTAGLTAFTAADGRFVSQGLEQQISHLEALTRLHGNEEFAHHAHAWRALADHWASMPIEK